MDGQEIDEHGLTIVTRKKMEKKKGKKTEANQLKKKEDWPQVWPLKRPRFSKEWQKRWRPVIKEKGSLVKAQASREQRDMEEESESMVELTEALTEAQKSDGQRHEVHELADEEREHAVPDKVNAGAKR